METIGFAHLVFDPQINNPIGGKKLTDGLSAIAQIGKTLWVANDETISLERLFLGPKDADGNYGYGNHTSFQLDDFIFLPVPPVSKILEEADIEGLDCDGGYLWLVGSHSLKRKKADRMKKPEKNIETLTKVTSDGNRYLLARIPLVEVGDGLFTLEKTFQLPDGKLRMAAQLPGDQKSSLLTQALKEEEREEKDPNDDMDKVDDHLKRFLKIPGKDNGFDIEGLAVMGNRIFIGLRGPVLRGWALILELKVEQDNDPSLLRLMPVHQINGKPRSFRKHFFELGGLGMRDLCVQGNDLLIMAGPTMDLDGPVTVFRWPDGMLTDTESIVFKEDLIEVGNLPFGKGEDHPEGMTLFSADDLNADALLIVNDATADPRLGRKVGANGFKADLFSLVR